MKRSLIICFAVLIVIAAAIALVQNERKSVLYAESDDSNWSACVIKVYGDPHGAKAGYLFYKGENPFPEDLRIWVTVDGTPHLINEKAEPEKVNVPSWEQKMILMESYQEVVSFMMSYDKENPKQIAIDLSWTEEGKGCCQSKLDLQKICRTQDIYFKAKPGRYCKARAYLFGAYWRRDKI
ncbi:MAG: hypothetical protein HFE76_12260 [Firmicutes bacterium]|nr:hypothetical protein [Bacillota bacterium]